MTTTAQVLRDAKALIADPDHWIKGKNTVLNDGQICRCSAGAIRSAAIHQSDGPVSSQPAYFAMWAATGGPRLTAWNDHPETTHADVMAAFDRAIESEEAKS